MHCLQQPRLLLIAGLCLFMATASGQDMKAYADHWEAQLPDKGVFNVAVSLQRRSAATGMLTLAGARSAIHIPFTFEKDSSCRVAIDSGVVFTGRWERAYRGFSGFVHSGMWQYHITLLPDSAGRYTGQWRVLLVPDLHSPFYISIEEAAGERYAAYAFCSEPRFPGFACYNFRKQADSLHFNDFRTGLQFDGRLLQKAIALRIKAGGVVLADVMLHPSAGEWNLQRKAPVLPYRRQAPADLQDGLPVGMAAKEGFNESYLERMVDSIHANKITHTHSVLIARKGRLVYEQYFGGFTAATPHDMRSASKSMSSAVIGIAMDKGILQDTGQKLFDLLPEKYRAPKQRDPRKAAISIRHLLTMCSGLDAVDFGTDSRSAAAEDVYQSTPDWTRTVTEAPVIHPPGAHANYGSANPFLLGVILQEQLQQPLELFIDENLFVPLGIDHYLLQRDHTNRPYFGGGWYLRPRDMLKFGLLYASGGVWDHKRILSRQWVDASFKKYVKLENTAQQHAYGFLWWHYHYRAGGKEIYSIEARGAGGQYIFIVPAYDLVVVVTSANYRNGRFWQPEKIMEDYILPAVVTGVH